MADRELMDQRIRQTVLTEMSNINRFALEIRREIDDPLTPSYPCGCGALSTSMALNAVRARIGCAALSYKQILSILLSIQRYYPPRSQKNILGKIMAIEEALNVLNEYNEALSDVEQGLKTLPTQFFG